MNADLVYSVVGVASDLKTSLRVMEKVLPRFFQGAEETYQRLGGEKEFRKNVSSNETAAKLSAEARTELERRLEAEIDFFQFVKKNLREKARRLGIPTKIADVSCAGSLLCRLLTAGN